MHIERQFVIAATLLLLAACAQPPSSAQSGITVSGVSSGAYMAVQVHVALGTRIDGAAAIAGGPYHCAQGDLVTALGPCLSGDGLDAGPLADFAREMAASGRIAPPAPAGRAWIFHSPRDSVVDREVSYALAEFYARYLPGIDVRIVDDVDAAHSWPADGRGGPCLQIGGAFVNDCDYDAAGELLEFLLGPLAAPVAAAAPRPVDLAAYVAPGSGVADEGYIHVPADCRSGASCRLHIAFHGCRQGAEFVGDAFAANAGLNEWAESNRMVVLYPQVESGPANPQGCWDWWGYTGGDYDLAGGAQVTAVRRILEAWESGSLH